MKDLGLMWVILTQLSFVANLMLRCKQKGVKITRYSFVAAGFALENWFPLRASTKATQSDALLIKIINWNLWLFYACITIIPLTFYLLISMS